MKALSVKEPYISLIVNGEKLIETRTWTTKYRGDVLLVGSKSPKGPYSGKAACVVRLCDIIEMTERDEFLARCKIYDRAQSWILAHIRPVRPFDVKGRLGLFDVPDDLIIYEDPESWRISDE